MKCFASCLLILSVCFPFAAAAQTSAPRELGGARFESAANRVADSNASFALGLSLDGGLSFRESAGLGDTVSIIARIRPEAAHVGQNADIFVVDRVNLVFMMQNQDGVFVPWNGRVPDLEPFREQQTLSADMELEIFSGTLAASGDHRFFIGYLPEDGGLRYTPVPHRLDIVEASAADRAFALFQSTISPDIIGSRCIQCHVSGGLAQAGGAFHIFRQPPGSFLETNYGIFRDLVALRGVSYVLTKVTGGNAHGGGVQLTAGSVDYQNLREFLELAAQDPEAQTGGQTPDPDPDPDYPDPYAAP